MKNFTYKTILYPFYHAAMAVLYIMGIAWVLFNAEDTFFIEGSFLIPAMMLSLFVLSAAVMSVLFFLKPVLMFLDNKKKEGLWFLGFTVGWFVFLGAIIFLAAALLSR